MSAVALSPYYHPTTVVFVDDNQAFLDSLDLELPPTLIAKKFVHPADALVYLNQPAALRPLVDRCFAPPAHAQLAPGADIDLHLELHLDLGLIEQEVNQLQRFQRTSVLVVDYAMPSMNGLELCAELTDPYLKIAMLTGVADEKIAVAAFNAGLIHRFVPKHGISAVEKIMQFITELQQEFFAQNTAQLRNVLTLDPPAFLVAQPVAEYVAQLMQDEALVEYYLVNDPSGLLLLNTLGELRRLIVLSDEQTNTQVEFARANGAPNKVIEQLARRQVLGYFWDHPQNYYGTESFAWDEHLFPATTLNSPPGEPAWHVALANDPPADVDFDPKASSFAVFLQEHYPGQAAELLAPQIDIEQDGTDPTKG